MRRPPNGKIALLNGASVCRPTITSLSLSIHPGSWASKVEGFLASTSSTPFLRSSAKYGCSFSQTALVLGDGPARKLWSPSYGVTLRTMKSRTSIASCHRPAANPRHACEPPRANGFSVGAFMGSSRLKAYAGRLVAFAGTSLEEDQGKAVWREPEKLVDKRSGGILFMGMAPGVRGLFP